MPKHKKTYTTKTTEETKKIAGEIIQATEKHPRKKARVFALSGELGAGKTQFVKGAAEYLKIERNITSPTFVIMKRYGNLYHLDCYRVENTEEILELGWNDIVLNEDNIVLVEWPEKIKNVIPKSAVWVKIKRKKENEREIIVQH